MVVVDRLTDSTAAPLHHHHLTKLVKHMQQNTAVKVAIRQLTGVSALVNLEIFASGENLAASWVWTRKWFLASMDSNVIHQLVLCLEGTSIARTVTPETGVIGALRAADVLHRYVGHYFVHRREDLVAGFL